MKTQIIDRTTGGSGTNILPSSEQGATQYTFTFAYEEEDHPKIALNPESGYIKDAGLVTVGPSLLATPFLDSPDKQLEGAPK